MNQIGRNAYPFGNAQLVPFQQPIDQILVAQEEELDQQEIIDEMEIKIALAELHETTQEKGAKRIEDSVQRYFERMEKMIAGLAEENRQFRMDRVTTEANSQLEKKILLSAINDLTEANKQLAMRLDETNQSLDTVKKDLMKTNLELDTLKGHSHTFTLNNPWNGIYRTHDPSK